ncbi:MAG TPA: PBSX family phage terminase large subunit, partial [Ruminococcaceae bacterium]|nr:PBSX family phage terminase large subunit [Oscillospiraceae bacterium]
MKFSPFTPKQLRALNWWCPGSPYSGCDAVICDGAVRSGKTLCLGLSFAAWACGAFRGQTFAVCGKTIRSLRRNLVGTLVPALAESGFSCTYKVSENLLEIAYGKN